MDPLNPITAPAGHPSRRVPPVDRLQRIRRDGDKPRREPSERRPPREGGPAGDEGEDGGEGHIDVRV
jgi:hypothetical protein